MKKFLLIVLTIVLAYITAYNTSGKKQNEGDLFYKIKCFISGETDTTDASSLSKEATRMFDYGEYNEAIKYYQKAIDIDSNYNYLYYSIAESYLSMQDTNHAIKTLLTSRYKNKNSNEPLLLLAEIYLQKGDTSKAEKYLNESNEIYETSRAFKNLSEIYLRRKNYDKAYYCISKGMKISPNDVSLLESKRTVFLALNMPDSAALYYQKIKSLSPDFYTDYAKLAQKAKDENKTREAINYYSLAINNEPNNTDYIDARGWLYIDLKMYDSAYYDFNRLVQLDSTSYYYYFNRAYVLDFFDSIQEAIRDYKISLIYKTDYNYTYNNLGYEYYRLKDFKNAEKYYSKCIELTPDYYLGLYNRGILYYDYQKYDKAIKDFKNALANSPDNTGIIYYMALSYDKLKNNTKALDYYNEYIRLSGDDIDSTDYEFVIKRIAELSTE